MPVKAYRSHYLPIRVAESFAACIRANPRFTGVEVHVSNSDSRRGWVSYLPADQGDKVFSSEEADRQQRAESEEFVFIDGKPLWVFNPETGKHYQVSSAGCSCPDYQFRCRALGISCKHMQAAQKAGKLTRSLAQRVAETREAIRKEGIG